MNKEQLDTLLPMLENYFDSVTEEQFIKDIEDSGCSHMIEEVKVLK